MQSYTKDAYALGNIAATVFEQWNNNFEVLRSAFSGPTAPANPIPGQPWLDTTNRILKVRNEANTVWLSVWDMANNKPIITNLSNEITLDMMAASAKSPAAGTEGLRKLGTGALDAMPGNASLIPADGSVTEAKLGAGAVTVNKIGSSAVSQAKLKTSTGEINTSDSSGEALTLPGGSYGFYPQVKSSGAGYTITAYIANSTFGTTYVASIYLKPNAGTAFVTQRYVTSSGEVNWYFILRDKDTGEIIASYFAPDHPCFGNGGDPDTVPHPFPDYDPNKHEVVCINPDHSEIKAIAKRKGSKGILEVLQEEYVIDEQPAKWPTKAVTVGLSDEYDHVDDEKAIETIKMAIPHPKGVLCRTLRVK